MYSTLSGETIGKSPRYRHLTYLLTYSPFSVIGAFACAMITSSSSSAVRYRISSVTTLFFTTRYGVSMKPNWFTKAWTQSDEMRPIFGPSGVSIGQRRP